MQKTHNHYELHLRFTFNVTLFNVSRNMWEWRRRMGVEPTCAARNGARTVLKTAAATGPQPPPYKFPHLNEQGHYID